MAEQTEEVITPGVDTSEFKLTIAVLIVSQLFSAIGAGLAVVQSTNPNALWAGIVMAVLGQLISGLKVIVYTISRGKLKSNTVNATAPREMNEVQQKSVEYLDALKPLITKLAQPAGVNVPPIFSGLGDLLNFGGEDDAPEQIVTFEKTFRPDDQILALGFDAQITKVDFLTAPIADEGKKAQLIVAGNTEAVIDYTNGEHDVPATLVMGKDMISVKREDGQPVGAVTLHGLRKALVLALLATTLSGCAFFRNVGQHGLDCARIELTQEFRKLATEAIATVIALITTDSADDEVHAFLDTLLGSAGDIGECVAENTIKDVETILSAPDTDVPHEPATLTASAMGVILTKHSTTLKGETRAEKRARIKAVKRHALKRLSDHSASWLKKKRAKREAR